MAESVKSLMKAGVFKRKDGYAARYADLKVEPGFNLRADTEELREHIQGLKAAILRGEELPALEVRVAANGDTLIVDGHCRHAAMGLAIAEGAPIEWVDVVPFRGNDVDRVARIITSQGNLKLSPLEVAMGYKRLRGMGLDVNAIAQRFGKTPQHVGQALLLADANQDVHTLVAGGKVSAAVATEVVRKHGEEAGKVLAGELEKAERTGKAKVTAGTMKTPKLPAKVYESVAEELSAFGEALPQSVRQEVAYFERIVSQGLDVSDQYIKLPATMVLSLALEANKLAAARHELETKQRQKAEKAAQAELPA